MNEAPPTLSPSGNHKIWAMLCHLSGLIGVGLLLPIVVYFAMRKESAYLACNSRSALNFHLSLLIYGLCCIPLIFVVIGIPLLILLGIASLVVSIIAAVKASDGECYHYPLSILFFH